MVGPRRLVLGLASLVLLAPAASASPIQSFSATYSDSLGVATTVPIALPNLDAGGSVVLGTIPISGSSIPASGKFDLQIAPTPTAVQGNTPTTLSGPLLDITGSLASPSSGAVSYSGTGAMVGLPDGANGLNNDPPLAYLLLNTGRIHILDQEIAGSSGQNLIQTTLTIDPLSFLQISGDPIPVPTPEPASLMVFLLAIGGWLVHRRASGGHQPPVFSDRTGG